MIVGIDIGARRVAIAALKDDDLQVFAYEVSKSETRATQMRLLAQWTLSTLMSIPFTREYIFVEEPLVGRSVRSSIQVAEAWGAVMSGIGMFTKHPTYDVSVTAWKKHVVGNGHAKKEDVAKHLKLNHSSYYQLCDGNQDLFDATCIALYGAEVRERGASLGASA